MEVERAFVTADLGDPHLGGHGRHETGQVTGERVENTSGMRRAPVRQDEEAAGSGGHDVVFAEQWKLFVEEAAGVGVQQKQLAFGLGDLVEDDPPAWLEAGVGGVILGFIGGGAPAGADGAEAHVVVEVVRGQEGVGDAADEVAWERGPFGPVYSPHRRGRHCPRIRFLRRHQHASFFLSKTLK
jgi:hypothetical protein